MTDTATPPELGESGAALWAELVDLAEFDAHELSLLVEACRTRDRLDELDAVVRREGVTVASPQGVKAHPALVEARAQQVVMTRLLASLRIPTEDDARPQRRGSARGAYGVR